MRLRTRLFLLVGVVVAVVVTLVTSTVSAVARRSFEALDRQRTDAVVLQFRREFAAQREEVARRSFRALQASWVTQPPEPGACCEVQIRHRGKPLAARIEPDGDDVRVTLSEPAVGVAPGQSAVFYSGDCVLGGARIA